LDSLDQLGGQLGDSVPFSSFGVRGDAVMRPVTDVGPLTKPVALTAGEIAAWARMQELVEVLESCRVKGTAAVTNMP